MTNDLVASGPQHRQPSMGIGSVPGAGPRSMTWTTAAGPLTMTRPRVMGVINITPDSFWVGSRASDPSAALRQAETMLREGADLLDIGGESTRPGAAVVPVERELGRVVPVIDALVREWPGALLSVDTVKADVAKAAMEAGAAIVNDVSGLRLDPAMAGVVAGTGAGLVLMHSRGTVETMAGYDAAAYGPDPAADIAAELDDAMASAIAAGIAAEQLVLDPGLGFSKRTEHSTAVLRRLDRVVALARPIMVGPSRKRFVGELAGGAPADQRLPGTIAACVAALLAGARIFRVHDVGPVRQALDVAEAVAP